MGIYSIKVLFLKESYVFNLFILISSDFFSINSFICGMCECVCGGRSFIYFIDIY